jgi:hypothetical protein
VLLKGKIITFLMWYELFYLNHLFLLVFGVKHFPLQFI